MAHKSQINNEKIESSDGSSINTKLQLKSASTYSGHNWEEYEGEQATTSVFRGFSYSQGREREYPDPFTKGSLCRCATKGYLGKGGTLTLTRRLVKRSMVMVDGVELVDKIVQQIETGGIGILGDLGSRSKIHDSGQQSSVNGDFGMGFTCVCLFKKQRMRQIESQIDRFLSYMQRRAIHLF